MKLLLILALIINIADYGEIPSEGMEMTINEAHEDILTGEVRMDLDGTLLCDGDLTVTITRSSAGLEDEFCCADQCTTGNGQTSESLAFTPQGIAKWFIHYTPAAGSYETVTYRFEDNTESRTLTVHYDYTTQGVERVQSSGHTVQKVLRDGILYIMQDNKTYTIL